MRQIKKLASEGYYLIICRSTAKSKFFENRSEVRLFESQFRRHLSKMVDIMESYYCDSGYVLIISTKSEKAINNAYNENRRASTKAKKGEGHKEIWRKISEHFRLLGSTFVKMSNERSGRNGTKFRKSYERYSFDNFEELKVVMALIQQGNFSVDQDNREFQIYRKTGLEVKYPLSSNEKERMGALRAELLKKYQQVKCLIRPPLIRFRSKRRWNFEDVVTMI